MPADRALPGVLRSTPDHTLGGDHHPSEAPAPIEWSERTSSQGVRLMRGRDPLRRPEPLIRVVYAYVAYRIGPGADADDLTGDVFERALRYRESFDPDKGTPTAWLIGIARRCVDRHLGRPSTIPLEDSPEVATADDLEEATLRKLSMEEALSRLGDRDRELIALRYGADLTARHIAELLSLSPNAVEVALHRAIERLKQTLDRS
jgi:RNA polymerase sigma-70 factor (ECF subfamily)